MDTVHPAAEDREGSCHPDQMAERKDEQPWGGNVHPGTSLRGLRTGTLGGASANRQTSQPRKEGSSIHTHLSVVLGRPTPLCSLRQVTTLRK